MFVEVGASWDNSRAYVDKILEKMTPKELLKENLKGIFLYHLGVQDKFNKGKHSFIDNY